MCLDRRESDWSFKYSLTNITLEESWERLGWIQGQRYWIEHAFHEAKNQIGMAQYQVRVWKGWHHHISLTCLALLFTVKMRHQNHGELPLLSTRDIAERLDFSICHAEGSPKQNFTRRSGSAIDRGRKTSADKSTTIRDYLTQIYDLTK